MMGSGMMGLGLIWMVVVLVGLVALVVWLVKLLFPQDSGTPASEGENVSENDALEIARRRYARGDITAEEFSRIKRDLV